MTMKEIFKINLIKGFIYILLPFVVAITGCEKAIEVAVPVNQIPSAAAFQDSLTAQATVNGMYAFMYTGASANLTTNYSVFASTLPARSADELYLPATPTDEFANNSLIPGTGTVNTVWLQNYQIIYQANEIIAGMGASSLSPTLKKQLIGEAKFMRAFCHFYLVNLYGAVPLITTTDIAVTRTQPQSTVSQIYSQIISDLKDAQGSLAQDYSWSAGLRTRVNSWAATALLARVYLYNKDYVNAEAEASKVIAQSSMYSLPAKLSNVFLKASTETIWAFNTNQYGYASIARVFIPLTASADPNHAMTASLVAAFERDALRPDYQDDRFDSWVKTSASGKYYNAKYGTITAANTEFFVVLRLAEQYLIRAEAMAQQNNLTGSLADINVIRSRAGLHPATAQTQAELLLAVEHERQVELFGEFGHRWFDLKRTGRADAVLAPVKGSAWQSTDVLYPIPALQVTNNPALVQNSGY
jgi:hypothetical protein